MILRFFICEYSQKSLKAYV